MQPCRPGSAIWGPSVIDWAELHHAPCPAHFTNDHPRVHDASQSQAMNDADNPLTTRPATLTSRLLLLHAVPEAPVLAHWIVPTAAGRADATRGGGRGGGQLLVGWVGWVSGPTMLMGINCVPLITVIRATGHPGFWMLPFKATDRLLQPQHHPTAPTYRSSGGRGWAGSWPAGRGRWRRRERTSRCPGPGCGRPLRGS